MKAQGTDAKGRGGAHAKSSFRIEETPGGGSKVLVHTDLALSGSVAQYGRGVGMIQATAAQIMNQFAANLKAQIARDSATPSPPLSPAPCRMTDGGVTPASPPAPPPAAKPISGFSLMAKVIWASIVRLFSRPQAGVGAHEMVRPIRRIVAGNDDTGKAVVFSDAPRRM